MPEGAYGIIEMTLTFGVLIAFLVWQLVKTRAGVRADRERAARERAEREGENR